MSYSKPIKLTVIYSIPFMILLGLLVIMLTGWNVWKHKSEQTAEFLETGRTLTSHILANMDSENIDGIYRLFSQAPSEVMSMRIMDLKERSASEGRVSLGQEGVSESYLIEKKKGKRYFHYMRKVRVPSGEEKILSFELPMRLSDRIHAERVKRDILSFLLIGILSIISVFVISWRLSKRVSSGIDRELEEKRLRALIELAGATAHEMRQPLAVVIGYSDLLADSISRGEPVDNEARIIKEQCFRMDDIIKKMLNITHYRTVEYTDGIRILDFHSQGRQKMNQDPPVMSPLA